MGGIRITCHYQHHTSGPYHQPATTRYFYYHTPMTTPGSLARSVLQPTDQSLHVLPFVRGYQADP